MLRSGLTFCSYKYSSLSKSFQSLTTDSDSALLNCHGGSIYGDGTTI